VHLGPDPCLPPRLMTSSRDEEQPLLDRVQHLELELNLLKSQLSDWQHLKTSCEQVSAGVRRLLP
jgi:SUN domain-containing protein 1/2